MCSQTSCAFSLLFCLFLRQGLTLYHRVALDLLYNSPQWLQIMISALALGLEADAIVPATVTVSSLLWFFLDGTE